MQCKEWVRAAGLFSEKCPMIFVPVEGQNGCQVCVTPVQAEP